MKTEDWRRLQTTSNNSKHTPQELTIVIVTIVKSIEQVSPGSQVLKVLRFSNSDNYYSYKLLLQELKTQDRGPWPLIPLTDHWSIGPLPIANCIGWLRSCPNPVLSSLSAYQPNQWIIESLIIKINSYAAGHWLPITAHRDSQTKLIRESRSQLYAFGLCQFLPCQTWCVDFDSHVPVWLIMLTCWMSNVELWQSC